MIVSGPALVGGALTGLGIAGAVLCARPARPRLADVLAATHSPTAQSTGRSPGGGRLVERVGGRLAGIPMLAERLPRTDLALLEVPAAHLVGRAAAFALLGAAIPQWVVMFLALAGTPPPWAIPAVASLAMGAFLALKSVEDVRGDARRLREEYAYAITSLMERAAIARVADAGAADAVYRAAGEGDTRAAVQIREALERARYAGTSPWEALERLGRRIGVEALIQPAQTLALAGEDGAAIHAALQHQASAQRSALQSGRKAEANEATESMIVPVIAVVFTMVLFLLVPAVVKIMQV